MLTLANVEVTFSEIPEEITLCINIAGCPIKCPDCHSKYLWNEGTIPLYKTTVDTLIDKNDGITCVALMGGDKDVKEVYALAEHIKKVHSLKVAWYSGGEFRQDVPLQYFDYIKTGPYIKEFGGLDNPKTNQRFYKVSTIYQIEDVTEKFQKIKIKQSNETSN